MVQRSAAAVSAAGAAIGDDAGVGGLHDIVVLIEGCHLEAHHAPVGAALGDAGVGHFGFDVQGVA